MFKSNKRILTPSPTSIINVTFDMRSIREMISSSLSCISTPNTRCWMSTLQPAIEINSDDYHAEAVKCTKRLWCTMILSDCLNIQIELINKFSRIVECRSFGCPYVCSCVLFSLFYSICGNFHMIDISVQRSPLSHHYVFFFFWSLILSSRLHRPCAIC